jgi:bacterioferritin-associated ferredoxin
MGEEDEMYVCVCRAVSDFQVKTAIDAGADSVEAVIQDCCAGEDCGACHGAIEALIEQRSVGLAPLGACQWAKRREDAHP